MGTLPKENNVKLKEVLSQGKRGMCIPTPFCGACTVDDSI